MSRAAHSTGRQRRDSSLPSGNTSGSTKAVRQTAGAKLHVLIQRNAVPKGSDPGECTSVYRVYTKTKSENAAANAMAHSSGPIR